MIDPDARVLLRSAFPGRLSSSVEVVLDTLPPGHLQVVAPHEYRMRIGGEELSIPKRIYYPEPADTSRFTTVEHAILGCLYTRHPMGSFESGTCVRSSPWRRRGRCLSYWR